MVFFQFRASISITVHNCGSVIPETTSLPLMGLQVPTAAPHGKLGFLGRVPFAWTFPGKHCIRCPASASCGPSLGMALRFPRELREREAVASGIHRCV